MSRSTMILALTAIPLLLLVDGIVAGDGETKLTIDCSKVKNALKLFTCENDEDKPEESAAICRNTIGQSFSRIRCAGGKATHCLFVWPKTDSTPGYVRRLEPATYCRRPSKLLECLGQAEGVTATLTAKYTDLDKPRLEMVEIVKKVEALQKNGMKKDVDSW